MFSISFYWIIWLFFLTIINGKSNVSYNEPKFCSYAMWNQNATTFAHSFEFGKPHGIFIDRHNNIYVADTDKHTIQIWLNENENENERKEIGNIGNNPHSLFVSNDNYIYFEISDRIIKKIDPSYTAREQVETVDDRCYGLFIDINDTLYCSVKEKHKVIKFSLKNGTNNVIIAAGRKDSSGSALDTLNQPWGIFVDRQFNLYVADCGNNRIQRFRPGQVNGTTIAGLEPINGKNLSCPTGVVLDGNNHLFIVDQNNKRIIMFNSIRFECVIGCSYEHGSSQLDKPYALAFNSMGDMYVVDSHNKRLQKYNFISTSCTLPYNRPKFCSFPSWKPEAETIATKNDVDENPYGIFVSANDSVYVPVLKSNKVLIWPNTSNAFIEIHTGNWSRPISLFVTSDNIFYVGNGKHSSITVIASNQTHAISLINVTKPCHGLFVDILNNLYCSVPYHHLLVKKKLNNHTNASEIIATGGNTSSLPTILNRPRGIFVDQYINIYVADSGHHRVIRLDSTLHNFTVVAGGQHTEETIGLNEPSGVVLDADGYLYIVDERNERIVGSGPYGFRCLVGCSSTNGSASDQLRRPWTMYFDSKGNMYVTDVMNRRIQKFLIATNSCDLPYNRPKLTSCAAWNVTGTTFVNNSMTGNYANGIFVDRNNNVYLTNNDAEYIQIWSQNGTTTTMRNVSVQPNYHFSLFVTIDNDIYVANIHKSQVQKFLPNGTEEYDINLPNMSCYGLFIDVNNNFYCSAGVEHKVVRVSLLSKSKNVTVVAGNGKSTLEPYSLNTPYGIFVDVHLTLFVADYNNDRIQRFKLNRLNGTTVVGNGSTKSTHNLYHPTSVVLDSNGNLFIVDHGNHRILMSRKRNHVQCLIGCNDNNSASNHLFTPFTMNFDNFGNMYVVDTSTKTVQKFDLLTNICNNNHTDETTIPSEVTTTATISETNTQTAKISTIQESSTLMTSTKPIDTSTPSQSTTLETESSTQTIESSTIQESSTLMASTDYRDTSTPSQLSTTAGTGRKATESSTIQETSTLITSTSPIDTSTSSTHVFSASVSLSNTEFITQTPSTIEISVITSTTRTLEVTSSVLKPKQCNNSSLTGINCSVPNTPCNHLKPCLNNGNCTNIGNGYNCTCLAGFNGTECQHDQRICKQFGCFNHGKCNKTFHCICDPGWQGVHCQTKIDFCVHHRCQNNAICRSLIQNYTCECLGNYYYYGQYCEKMTTKVRIFKVVSKSFAYIAILAITLVALFIIIMDILKYGFGIDPVEEERERMRKEKAGTKQKSNNSQKTNNKKAKKQKA